MTGMFSRPVLAERFGSRFAGGGSALLTRRRGEQEWTAVHESSGARFDNHAAQPTAHNVAAPTPTNHSEVPTMQGSTLTAAELQKASSIIARMGAPLTADEKRVCQLTGVSEDDFRKERDLELYNQLPGKKTTLTADELHVAKLCGLTPEQFAQAKVAEGR
ncbi:MAG: hypothetical protein ACOY0T_09515 [Myxococcota bacterium]